MLPKLKKVEEHKEAEVPAETQEDEEFAEIPDKPIEKKPAQTNNGSSTSNNNNASPVDKKNLNSSGNNISPSLISARKTPSSKKGIAAGKVSNDFLSEWDNIENNGTEEEEPQVEEKPKEEEKKVIQESLLIQKKMDQRNLQIHLVSIENKKFKKLQLVQIPLFQQGRE